MTDYRYLAYIPSAQFAVADIPEGGLSPRIERAALDFLQEGSTPSISRTLDDPQFLSELIRVGAIRIPSEFLVEAGLVQLSEDREVVRGRLASALGEATIEGAKRYLREQPGSGIEDLVDDDVIPFPLLPELLVGVAAAQGGVVFNVSDDACSLEERSELRRLNSEAITDWFQNESNVISDNFDNGVNGLTLFVNFLTSVSQSVTSGVKSSVTVGAEVVLWTFAVSVPLQGVVLGVIAGAIGAAITANDRILENGVIRLEALRASARDSLEARVKKLRDEVTAAGNNCPRLRDLLRRNRNLPRTRTTSALLVYRNLLAAWGHTHYEDDLTPPNPVRQPPEDRDKWILYGGYADVLFFYDGYDLVAELNRIERQLRAGSPSPNRRDLTPIGERIPNDAPGDARPRPSDRVLRP